jgi:DNA ligase-4
MDWSSQVTFKEFCDFLQHLVRTKVKANKLNLMKKFLGVWRARLPSTESSSLFPLMRLLLPQLDKERGAYNIKVRVLSSVAHP